MRTALRGVLLAFLFQTIASANANATWNKVAQFPARVMCGFFFDPLNGFVCVGGTTSTAAIMRTTDGGTTWTSCAIPAFGSPSQIWFDDIWMRDRNEGYATLLFSTSGSNVWHTTDGGLSWANTGFSGNPVAVRQTSKALIVSQWSGRGFNLSFDNGTSFPTGSGFSMNGLSFVDDLHGAASGFYNQFYYTSDGGLHWSTSNSAISTEAWGIYGESGTGNFLAAPESAYNIPTSAVYVSTNFGADWIAVDTLPFKTSGDVEGVGFAMYVQNSGSNGGPPGLFRTTDLGRSWTGIGGPNSGRWDIRFCVTDCGNVIYAFDSTGAVWKTEDAGDGAVETACELPIRDRFPDLASSLCDSSHQLEFLHNQLPDTITVLSVAFADTSLSSVRSHGIHLDSVSAGNQVVLPGDSLGLILGWEPGRFRATPGDDSTLVRVIYLIGRIGRRDTVFVQVGLRTLVSRLAFALGTQGIRFDTVLMCSTVDTTLKLSNTGCDSFSVTKAFLQLSEAYTLLDSLGQPVSLPLTLAAGTQLKFRLRFTPVNRGPESDSLVLSFHQWTNDTTVRIPVSGFAKRSDPFLSQQQVQFHSIPTCASQDSLFDLVNLGCDSLVLTSLDLKSLDWTLLDSNGGPLNLPLTLAAGESIGLKLHFAPDAVGSLGSTMLVHFRYEGFDSVHTILLAGTGSVTGTLGFERAVDFGDVSLCSTVDSMITFSNSTCEKVLIDSILVPAPYFLVDSSRLPIWLDPGSLIRLRLRYHPSAKVKASRFVILKNLVNGTLTWDTIVCTGTGISGTSVLQLTPAVDSFNFEQRSECDFGDSVRIVCRNTGCDTLSISNAFLTGTLDVFDLTSSLPVPIELVGDDSVVFWLKLSRPVAGSYNGVLDLKLKDADGIVSDSLLRVSGEITKGTRTLSLDTTSIALGSFNVCTTVDTVVVYTNTGCAPLTLSSRSFRGTGLVLSKKGIDPIILLPKESDTLRLIYDNSTVGSVGGVATVVTDADVNPTRSIALYGVVRPADSIRFVLQASALRIEAGKELDVGILPDRSITAKELRTFAASLIYRGDGLQFVQAVPAAGFTLSSPLAWRDGREEHLPFILGATNDVIFDPTLPLVTFRFQAKISDSSHLPLRLDSLLLNGGDLNFSRCILESTSLPAESSLDLQCGDSTIEISLRSAPILSASLVHPDPVVANSATLQLRSRVNGVAKVEVRDLMGKTVIVERCRLRAGMTSVCTLDLKSAPSGAYFYVVSFIPDRWEMAAQPLHGSFFIAR